MNIRKWLVRATASFLLGTVAPLVIAQTSSGGDNHARDHDNPAWQACRKQADDKALERGPQRRSFMQDCLRSAKDNPPKP
jgi:hypothetical protein